MTAAAAPLAGRGIVVTRPEQQAGPLAGRIRAAGGEAILSTGSILAGNLDIHPVLLSRLTAAK